MGGLSELHTILGFSMQKQLGAEGGVQLAGVVPTWCYSRGQIQCIEMGLILITTVVHQDNLH